MNKHSDFDLWSGILYDYIRCNMPGVTDEKRIVWQRWFSLYWKEMISVSQLSALMRVPISLLRKNFETFLFDDEVFGENEE
jgi:hypothetical protein